MDKNLIRVIGAFDAFAQLAGPEPLSTDAAAAATLSLDKTTAIEVADALRVAASSVLQPWVMLLPRRFQGTLLAAVRSCDAAPKERAGDHSPERALTAYLRWLVMNPADDREVEVEGAFFRKTPPTTWRASMFGHYPVHWYSHLMHAFEVVGHCHPDKEHRVASFGIYTKLVHGLHLEPETREQMELRLTEDRIAAGTVVS